MENVKVALLIDDMAMPVWVEHMLKRILQEPGIEIALIVKNGAPKPKKSLINKVLANTDSLLISAWREVDKRLFPVPNNAFRTVDMSPVLAGIPQIEVIPEQKKFSDYFNKADIKRIEQHEITVFIRLGFRILRGDIITLAPCGIWSFHHGDNLVNRGGPAGVWEVLLGTPTTGSILQILTEDLDGGSVLSRSWSATNPYSIHRNLNNYYWKSLSLIPRKLRELRQTGVSVFMAKHASSAEELAFYKDRLFVKPRNPIAAKLITRLLMKIAGRALWRTHHIEQWMLAYHVAPDERLSTSIYRFKQLIPPKDRIWADPFVIEHNGKTVVFIEEMELSDRIGYLSVIEFDADSKPILPPVKILQKPYHLSYPHVFEAEGAMYMVPETQQNGTIELYRCTGFPHQWEFVMNLMDGVQAVDTTIWHHQGKYWLFTNLLENKGASTHDELFLFSSDTLLTQKWKPHPCNPIVSDVRCARPAGKIFSHNGQWYRPAQDCSDGYGKAIAIQRIDTISEEAYQETPASRITPDWDKDVIRTHTLSHAGRLTFIDGLRQRRKYL